MVLVMNEQKAKKLFESYDDVIAFSWNGAKGPSKEVADELSEKNVVVSYQNPGFLPSEDTIKAIINGDISLKKVIKQTKKAFMSFNKSTDESSATAIAVYIIMSLYSSNKYPVLVFVEPEESDEYDHKVNKIMKRFISEIFAEFGPIVIGGSYKNNDDKKLMGKLTKKIKKSVFKVKKRGKIRKNIHNLMDDYKFLRINKDGVALMRRIKTIYNIEVNNAGINNIGIKNLKSKKRETLATNLKNILSGENLYDIGHMNPSNKKDEKRLAKAIKSTDKAHLSAYKELCNSLKGIQGYDIKMPKIRFGYKKNKKKKLKKFVEFFGKNKNAPLLALTYAHLTCVRLGVEVGRGEYKKLMKASLSGINKEFVDILIAAITNRADAV